MSGDFNNVKLLIWKNTILLRRSPIKTILHILIPVIVAILLVYLRSRLPPEDHATLLFEPFSPLSVSSLESTMQITLNSDLKYLMNSASEDRSRGKRSSVQTRSNNASSQFILYAPDTTNTKRLMEWFKKHFGDIIKGFKSTRDLEHFDMINASTLFAFEFDNLGAKDSSIDVTIRFPMSLRSEKDVHELEQTGWMTHLLYPLIQLPGPRSPKLNVGGRPSYQDEQFLLTQQFITMALISYQNKSVEFPSIQLQRYPHSAWREDLGLKLLGYFLGMILTTCLGCPWALTLIRLTNEKENQSKEYMRIMGLVNWQHWTAWFVVTFICYFISMVLVTIFTVIIWLPGTEETIFTHTNSFLLLIFLVLIICSCITFCFAVSVLFSRATTAAMWGSLFYYILVMPYLLTITSNQNWKLASCLAMNSAACHGFQIILQYEASGEGSQWSNLFSSSTVGETLSLGIIFIILIIHTLIYMCFVIYFDILVPAAVDVGLPWYFLCTKRYWLKQSASNVVANIPEIQQEKTDNIEPEPTNLPVGIEIRNLRKVFHKDAVVNNLSITMYEDQIFVLLGHNGAGKTTTMSIISGMIRPTSGTAIINGFDIRTNKKGVKSCLGLCPQHNIIFDELTVKEHFQFYSKLKGMKSSEINEEADKYIKLLGLEDKANARTKTLSGGMKRKVCVGIALCGNSKIVLLDEPTAGIDPIARRAVWNLLQAEKTGRTIVLTTHLMDEADLLGDRIGVMLQGELECCGSSFFLKKKYGAGYKLVLEKTPNCQPDEVKNFLKKYIPEIEILNNTRSELSFILPEKYSSQYQSMLTNLEANYGKLRIRGYGISLTTMEEVFLKTAAATPGKNGKSKASLKQRRSTYDSITENNRLSNRCELIKNQYRAMFMKRIISTRRTWKLFLLACLTPTVLLIGVLLFQRLPTLNDQPALRLTSETYEMQDPLILVQSTVNDSSLLNRFRKFAKPTDSSNITGEILEMTKSSPISARTHHLYGATFEKKSKTHITAWFNNDAYHTAPIALSLILNSIYQDSVETNGRINFINHPLPEPLAAKFNKQHAKSVDLLLILGWGMAFYVSYYIIFVMKEKISNSKHLQQVSGVNVLIFWTTTFFCDYCTYVISVLCFLIVLAVFQEDGYRTIDQLTRLLVILLCFGYAALAMVYFLSYILDRPATGYQVALTICIAAVIIFSLRSMLPLIMHQISLIIPSYAMCAAIKGSYDSFTYKKLCQNARDACMTSFNALDLCWKLVCDNQPDYCCDEKEDYYKWEEPGIGLILLCMIAVGTILFIMILLIDYRICRELLLLIFPVKKAPDQTEDEDDDVAEERKYVHSAKVKELAKENVILLKDLTKYYGKSAVVNGLCLAIKEFECFGLLGVNGAGKTTTFKMMTGDVAPSSGQIWVNGYSTKRNMKTIQKYIGYCPQFDALLTDLTCRETIKMFALLRGIPPQDFPNLIDEISRDFDFKEHLNKTVKQLSGGNKRKLSTAISTIGDPPVIYLDEPTAGMDPGTKRYLLDSIATIRDNGTCIVLTSHSMEECEALCTRLAIMVQGKFKCLGATQHLKNKFAKDYTLTIKVKKGGSAQTLIDRTSKIKTFVESNFGNVKLVEENQELITYSILDTKQSWPKMFGALEKSKKDLNIEDYSLGQSTLEQVFLGFAEQ